MIGPELAGIESEPVTVSWDARDVMLYALGVGAGAADPGGELGLTTENSEGYELAVLPSFGGSLVLRVRPDWNRAGAGPVLHASQAVRLAAPLPAAGTLVAQSWVEGVYDRRSGALVRTRTEARYPDGSLAFTVINGAFVPGSGGFGGPRGEDEPAVPDQTPDGRLVFRTRGDQALLFRLSGDRNPLHSDPARARQAGYQTPILHGLATSGIAVRLLVNELCHGDPAQVSGFSVRYTAPVVPGEELAVSFWRDTGAARFQVHREDGRLACDRGILTFFAA